MKRKLALPCVVKEIVAEIKLDSVDTATITTEPELQAVIEHRFNQLVDKSVDLYEMYLSLDAHTTVDREEYKKTLDLATTRKKVEEAVRKIVPKVKPKIRVPFDLDGNLKRYAVEGATRQVGYGYNAPRVPYEEKWVENYEFEDSLRLDGVESGMSAKYFQFTSTITGRGYWMFLNDLIAMLQSGVMDHGVVTGRWTFRKRADAYGVQYLGTAVENKPKSS